MSKLCHCWNEGKQSYKHKDLTRCISQICYSECKSMHRKDATQLDTCSTQQGVLLLSCEWRSAT